MIEVRCWDCRNWVEFYDADVIETSQTEGGLIINHYPCPECDAEVCVDMTNQQAAQPITAPDRNSAVSSSER